VEVSSGEAEFALLIGTSSYVEEAKSDLVPDELSLRQYPNPFQAQGQTTIEYSLPEQTEVSVKVYDVLGRRVRTLVSEETQRSGVHTLQWNARDKQGQAVASGVYFARLDAGQTRSIKMVVVK
jgi:flagellar hook assembly protein FlgD